MVDLWVGSSKSIYICHICRSVGVVEKGSGLIGSPRAVPWVVPGYIDLQSTRLCRFDDRRTLSFDAASRRCKNNFKPYTASIVAV